MLDPLGTIALMTRHHVNAGHWRPLRPDPRGRNAVDLPYTAAQAAVLARVLDEIRTSPATSSGRSALSGRNAGGASTRSSGAPSATPIPDNAAKLRYSTQTRTNQSIPA